MSLATAKELAENGIFDGAVINTLRNAGYSDNALYQLYGYDPEAGNQNPHIGDTGNRNDTIDMNTDMNPVIALGYGPISADRLAELEASGKIEPYLKGGKIKFRKKQNIILDAPNLPGWIYPIAPA